jgi:hypothetical protein
VRERKNQDREYSYFICIGILIGRRKREEKKKQKIK